MIVDARMRFGCCDTTVGCEGSNEQNEINFYTYYLLRASSDFDIRHNFQAAATYVVPVLRSPNKVASVLGGWGVDLRFQAQSALFGYCSSPGS